MRGGLSTLPHTRIKHKTLCGSDDVTSCEHVLEHSHPRRLNFPSQDTTVGNPRHTTHPFPSKFHHGLLRSMNLPRRHACA